MRYTAAELLRHESKDAGALRDALERALDERETALEMALAIGNTLSRLESRAETLWDQINMKDKTEESAFVELEELLSEELFSMDSKAPEMWPEMAPASFPYTWRPRLFATPTSRSR